MSNPMPFQINPFPVLTSDFRRALSQFLEETGQSANLVYLGQVEISVLIERLKIDPDAAVCHGPGCYEFLERVILPSGRTNGIIPALVREKDLPQRKPSDTLTENEQGDA